MKKFILPPLLYSPADLKDLFSEKQFEAHYYQHHKKYIEKANSLKEQKGMQLDSMVGFLIDDEPGDFFNQVAQAWSHTFFWSCLSPEKQFPSDIFLEKIKASGYNLEHLRDKFIEKGLAVFGSGWVWLVLNPNNHIEIVSTRNAKTPFPGNNTPILVADVWEHAYYLDYQASRKEYLEKFWNLINWSWVEALIKDKNLIYSVEKMMTEKEEYQYVKKSG